MSEEQNELQGIVDIFAKIFSDKDKAIQFIRRNNKLQIISEEMVEAISNLEEHEEDYNPFVRFQITEEDMTINLLYIVCSAFVPKSFAESYMTNKMSLIGTLRKLENLKVYVEDLLDYESNVRTLEISYEENVKYQERIDAIEKITQANAQKFASMEMFDKKKNSLILQNILKTQVKYLGVAIKHLTSIVSTLDTYINALLHNEELFNNGMFFEHTLNLVSNNIDLASVALQNNNQTKSNNETEEDLPNIPRQAMKI